MNPNEIAKLVAPFSKNETGCIPDIVIKSYKSSDYNMLFHRIVGNIHDLCRTHPRNEKSKFHRNQFDFLGVIGCRRRLHPGWSGYARPKELG
jgi:phosphoenolpyruvate carboxylase